MDPKTALEPGIVIADRFRIDDAITFEGAGPAFLATDQETHSRVLVYETTLAEADALRPAVGVQHAHLATVIGLVAHGERDVLITQYEPGQTVDAFADGTARLTRVDAVRFCLRILDALVALHQAGAVHGFVRPAAIVMEPEGRPRPVVGYAPAPLTSSAFRSPARGAGGAPSVADDAWAAGAVLHRMLTGKDPPAGGLEDEAALTDAGIDEPVLRAALFHALQAGEQRSDSLQPLRRELARWFADHAGDMATGHSSSMAGRPPPPLPAGITGPSASRPPPPPISGAPPTTKSMPTELSPKKRGSGPLIFAAVAAVLGLGAAWGVSAWRSRPKVTVITTSAPREAAPPPSAVSLGEVAVTAESESDGGVDRTLSCVAANFPKDTFKKAPDLSWLCAETDPRVGGEKLRVAVVQGGVGGAPTEAQQIFARLGWHEMTAFGVLHATCCNEPKGLSLPEPSAGCDPLVKAIDEIAKTVTAKQPIDDALAAFARAAHCETNAKRATLFRRTQAPQQSEETALKELLKSVSAP